MRRFIFIVLAILVIVAGLAVVRQVNHSNQVIHLKQIKLQDTEYKLNVLQQKFNTLDHQKAQSDQEVKQLDQQRQQLEDQKKQLEQQIQAKAEIKKNTSATVYAAALPAPSYADTSSDKAFIYSHESGNNPGSVAGNGACGLGQALPCSKLPCGLADYGCQDTWFTNYMTARYGTWSNAAAVWKSHATIYAGDWHGGWW